MTFDNLVVKFESIFEKTINNESHFVYIYFGWKCLTSLYSSTLTLIKKKKT